MKKLADMVFVGLKRKLKYSAAKKHDRSREFSHSLLIQLGLRGHRFPPAPTCLPMGIEVPHLATASCKCPGLRSTRPSNHQS